MATAPSVTPDPVALRTIPWSHRDPSPRRPTTRRPAPCRTHAPATARARTGLDEVEVAALLAAAGRGDLCALYDRTAPLGYGLLRAMLGAEAADRAAERVYLRVWHDAPGFDPDCDSACTLLLTAARQELVRPVHDTLVDRPQRD